MALNLLQPCHRKGFPLRFRNKPVAVKGRHLPPRTFGASIFFISVVFGWIIIAVRYAVDGNKLHKLLVKYPFYAGPAAICRYHIGAVVHNDGVDLAYDVFDEDLIQSFDTLQAITTKGLSGLDTTISMTR